MCRTRFIANFNSINTKLIRYTGAITVLLRLCIAAMLLISVFGVIPREGIERFSIPTLLVPDLELMKPWVFLSYIELFVALGFIIGFYTRFMSVLLMILCIMSVVLFGFKSLAYTSYYMGAAIYLLIMGEGPYRDQRDAFYESRYYQIANFTLRFFTGFAFIFSAIRFKFLDPNLLIGILEKNNAISFGQSYPTFAFEMALVELAFGFLIITGCLIRPLSLILLCLFTFLSFNVHENFFAHIFIYGILFTFIINGPTKWHL